MPVRGCQTTYNVSKEVEPPDDSLDPEEDNEPSGLCCISGCLLGTTGAIMFFLIGPAGVLLTVFGRKNNKQYILAIGIALLIMSVISVPVFLLVFYNRRRLKRLKRQRLSQRRNRISSHADFSEDMEKF